MKKGICCLALMLALVLTLTGCFCRHETWTDADCVTPKTCSNCGEVEGGPLGHVWAAATCDTPKTCETCMLTEGEALGHTWAAATCTAPKTCETCMLTEGEALGHTWLDATTEAPKTCAVCGLTEGDRIITDTRFTTAASKHFFGSWTGEIPMPAKDLGLDGMEDEIIILYHMEFCNDGTLILNVEPADIKAYEQLVIDFTIESTYADFESQGYSRDAADALIEATFGMSLTEYVKQMVSSMDAGSYFDMMSVTAVYYVDGNTVYTGSSWSLYMEPYTYSMNGDTLYMDIIKQGEVTAFVRDAE